jgi:hypothetical protein
VHTFFLYISLSFNELNNEEKPKRGRKKQKEMFSRTFPLELVVGRWSRKRRRHCKIKKKKIFARARIPATIM